MNVDVCDSVLATFYYTVQRQQ